MHIQFRNYYARDDLNQMIITNELRKALAYWISTVQGTN